ncbi:MULTISPECIES: ribonuclease E/G [unclassified Sphingomonas]|uniref:Rne/Rng family ribonuclease n=1 Tax=unclassified Sphingomonas TaxID=196159 RepID=UPI0021513641|nr:MULTISPECIES: Rne/Rng family ribonuclease [unclassified Sphingomonas]MCR5869851.1 Rne/Rng family ribonuclease [Sphingomonas sp. J344]UUX98447.1 Rne/Rng family ribonuclease [Sphingomonas sp. J315]
MTMRMLIDARHREETRVAVVKGNRIEEFDFESAERKQLKGNIYLAKVTRVEPSLQAAFVEYGGNRHGFLAFSEIHPDYYQIPKEDRDALLREEAEHAAEEAALREADDGDDHDHEDEDGDFEVIERPSDEDEDGAEAGESEGEGEEGKGGGRRRRGRKGSDDQVEALRQRRMNLRRRYKIQDVIRRRQVLLVQVVKEERGNKGAALTTYLSLAGRYCVLMPNTAHGGGISRKISSAADRKRLKTIMADLKLPPSMGCIVRTAGLQRTKTEIKRDFDYLARLWDEIREKTLQSSAPALVYGDSDLMKRAIRDIYNKDIDEVIVEGDDGYRQAKDFMKLLMPSHAKKVKHYSDAVPLFQRAGVEEQLSAMYHPVVQLKSGGYLVINPTEALVSIDINSGRSTREHSIEQTATATNLEAAQEIARQLRLRDMAGLVVIDFIDMDHSSNVRKVEKAMKEALKNDRARIQVGRISAFGLMEMSRQRLRTGVLEASTRQCPHCEGTGLVRTASSAGLSALRLIEDEAARGRGSHITLRCSQEAAFYVLNNKRADIAEIEDRYGVRVEILSDGELEGARMSVEASGPPPAHAPKFAAAIQEIEDDFVEEIDEEEEEEEEEVEARAPRERRDRGESEGDGRKRRRRRRGRRGRREDGDGPQDAESERDSDAEGADEAGEGEDAPAAEVSTADEAGEGRKRRRRGRRGGRRGNGGGEDGVGEARDEADVEADAVVDAQPEAEPVAEEAPAKPKRSRRKKADAAPVSEAAETVEAVAVEAPVELSVAEEAPAKPKRSRRKKGEEASVADAAPAEVAVAEVVEAPVVEEAPAKPKRSRRKKADEAPAAVVQDLVPAADDVETVPAAAEGEPAEAGVGEGGEDGSAPRRGGWWQRTFGA